MMDENMWEVYLPAGEAAALTAGDGQGSQAYPAAWQADAADAVLQEAMLYQPAADSVTQTKTPYPSYPDATATESDEYVDVYAAGAPAAPKGISAAEPGASYGKRAAAHRFGIYPTGYLVGTVLGAVFPLWANQGYDFLLLFMQNYLDGFCAASSTAALLSRHLLSQAALLAMVFFCGYSVFGAPVLLLGMTCKGALNGAVYTCVLTGLYQTGLRQFVLAYLLYDLGCTAVLFLTVWQLSGVCGALFGAFLRKKSLPAVSPARLEQLLLVLLGCLGWFLVCWLFSQSLFSAASAV